MALNYASLKGSACAGGKKIGSGFGMAMGFDVGEYVVVGPSLVLRASTDVENEDLEGGSVDGDVGALFVAPLRPGIGAGAIPDGDDPGPGSEALSGSGKFGSEIVHFNFYGDPMVAQPMMVPADSVEVQVADFQPAIDQVSLVLYHVNGARWRVFSPAIVEPLIRWDTGDTYTIRFKDLPGIADLESLGSFDVRSGWFNPKAIGNGKGKKRGKGKGKGKGKVCHNGVTIHHLGRSEIDAHLAHGDTFGKCSKIKNGKLKGGHFWISSVTYFTIPRAPLPSEAWD